MVAVAVPDNCRVAIIEDTLVRLSTEMWLIVTRIFFRSIERQRGIQTTGVDAMHDIRMMRILSVWYSRARPSVGCVPLVGIDTSSECPNGLEERVNSSGLGEEVASTVGVGGVSSSGIMWSMG